MTSCPRFQMVADKKVPSNKTNHQIPFCCTLKMLIYISRGAYARLVHNAYAEHSHTLNTGCPLISILRLLYITYAEYKIPAYKLMPHAEHRNTVNIRCPIILLSRAVR